MLFGGFDVSSLENLLLSKGVETTRQRWEVIRAGGGTTRASEINLTNFEIQRYDQNEAKFNGALSSNNLSTTKVRKYNESWWVQINSNLLDSFVC